MPRSLGLDDYDFALPPERIAQDAACGLVTKEKARRDYGVALRADGSVDTVETEALRAKMRKARGAPAPFDFGERGLAA